MQGLRFERLLAGALMAAAVLGCESDDSKATVSEQDTDLRGALLTNLTEDVFVPALEDFEQKAEALGEALDAYQAQKDDASRQAAEQAWLAANRAWQRMEMYQFGPAALQQANNPSGLDLRNAIYSWDSSNACLVDQRLADNSYATDAAFAELFVNARGLDILEYLVFNRSTDSSCPPTHSLIQGGAWGELAAELGARRIAAAQRIGADVRGAAEQLGGAWRGGFANELATAGDSGNARYSTTQQGFNDIALGLFYLDQVLKDMKLAIPAGYSNECAASQCPERVEHPYARVSKESIVINLEAFADAMRGKPEGERQQGQLYGFIDLLRLIEADALADEMDTAITTAIDAVGAIEGDLFDAVVDQPNQVQTAYDAVQALTTLFKTQFAQTLDLEVNMGPAGDND